jgi:antitoxin VapB
MAFSIKDPEIDKNLRLLAAMTGESLTEAVGNSIAVRLEQLEEEKAKKRAERNKRLRAFIKGIKPNNVKEGYDHKKFTDDLWGM